MSRRLVTVLGVVLVALLSTTLSSKACDPDEDCGVCKIRHPNGGCTLRIDDPACAVRRGICKACIAAKTDGKSACFVCVSAAIASGGSISAACAAACGSMAVANAVADGC